MTPALSRRTLLRYAATAALLPLAGEARYAWSQGRPASGTSDDAVLLNANENPAGPCPAARESMAAILAKGGRYLFDLSDELVEACAALNGLKAESVLVYAGSSEPLQYATVAFTSPVRSLVTANPTYEAAWEAAELNRARVHKVPLRADHSHDLKAMVARDPRAGVLYVCNPNNPTGTLTPRAEIEWALAHKPKGSILLVDEAYIQYTDEKPLHDLVAAGGDLIVLRTFSKLYGMAGIRCGYALGRPDLLKRLALFGNNPMPITALAGAISSLKDADLVPQRKRETAALREQTYRWLDEHGYAYTRGQGNCFSLDARRPGKQVIAAMAERGVHIGRTWTAWPNHVRITIGTAAEMERFKSTFKAVMDAPASKVAEAAGDRGARRERYT